MRRRWRSSAVLAVALVAGLSLPALAATTDDGGPEAPAATATATPEATPAPEVSDPSPAPDPTPTPSETPAVDDSGPTPTPTPPPTAPGEPSAEPQAAAPGATGSISGRVTAPAGTDLTRVLVRVLPEGGQWVDSSSAWVAADGTYTVSDLKPARYMVEFLGWQAGLVGEYWNDTQVWDQATLVTVGSGPVAGINATLAKGATFSGRIRTSSDCDLTHVNVWAHALGGGTTYDSTNNPDGTWSLTGLAAGRYWLEFDGRYAGLDRFFWNTSGRPYQHTEITVGLGQEVSNLDVTMNGPLRGCVPARPFVQQVYLDLLERDVDYSGLTAHVDALALRGVPRSTVADSITSSDEYRARLIRASYQQYLGRAADGGGVTTWLREMRRGADIEDIQAAFVASEEFWLRSGSTPAGWVENLYRSVLGRGAGSSEIQWWTQRLAAGASRLDVARGFLYSTEHLSTVVDGYYVDLLERHIDPTGRAQWVRLIQQGYRDEQIIAGILSSVEYAARVKRIWPGI